jgi:hypothetical protein
MMPQEKGWSEMSGYKHATVTISEREYRHLHEADMKRRFRGHTKIKAQNSGSTEDLINTLQQMENRQRQLEEAFGDLDQDFDRLDEDMVQVILEQNALCYQSLATVIEETASNASASLALVSERFSEQLQIEREHYQQNLQSVIQRLDTFEQREQAKMKLARQWLRQVVIFSDFIQEQFDHERFLPGQLSKILRSLEIAQRNLAEGLPEASLQISQQAFLGMSDLRLELEQRIVEWQAEYGRASGALDQFITELELNASVNALGLEGEELTERVDVAYWSNGDYQQLLTKCRRLSALLSQENQHITTEELKQTHAELLPVLTERFESIIYEARLNALNSQLRMNIAEQALQALESHGFRLNESGYLNKDMRSPFMAQLDSSDGSRVTIQVLPTDQTASELTNELVMVTNHPFLKTEHEARLRWEELCRSLNQYELTVSRTEVRSLPSLTAPDRVEQPAFLGQQPIHSKRQNNVR